MSRCESLRVRYSGVVVVESVHWVCLVWPGSRLDKDDGVHFGERVKLINRNVERGRAVTAGDPACFWLDLTRLDDMTPLRLSTPAVGQENLWAKGKSGSAAMPYLVWPVRGEIDGRSPFPVSKRLGAEAGTNESAWGGSARTTTNSRRPLMHSCSRLQR